MHIEVASCLAGIFEGKTVKFPCHKSVFNVKTGELLRGTPSKAAPKYAVRVEEEQIQVSIK